MTIFNRKDFGTITVNWGSMYSGKTEELLRQIRRASIGGKKYQLFKPLKDDRYSQTEATTHYGFGLEAIVVKDAEELFKHVDKDTHLIGIDEGQFFDMNLVEVCQRLKKEYHIDIIISGLDMKFNGEPFDVMKELAAISNDSKKFQAVCVQCGNDAYISHRLINDETDIVVGSSGVYVALCERHHIVELEKRK